MKKYLIIILVLSLMLLVGCNTGDGGDEPVIDFIAVGDVADSIDILYSDIDSLKYGNEDNVRQRVICSKEIKIRRYKLERGGRDYL